jgi:hypothetical protein
MRGLYSLDRDAEIITMIINLVILSCAGASLVNLREYADYTPFPRDAP